MAGLCNIYNNTVLPLTGALLSEKEAYKYLAQSIKQFPPAKDIANLFKNQGFEKIEVKPLNGGIVSIISGTRQ